MLHIKNVIIVFIRQFATTKIPCAFSMHFTQRRIIQIALQSVRNGIVVCLLVGIAIAMTASDNNNPLNNKLSFDEQLADTFAESAGIKADKTLKKQILAAYKYIMEHEQSSDSLAHYVEEGAMGIRTKSSCMESCGSLQI